MTEPTGSRRLQRIRPAEFQPPEMKMRQRMRLPRAAFWLLPLAGALLLFVLWYLFTLRSVQLDITPEPDKVSVSGLTMTWGQQLLARPGEYRLRANKEGYAPLDVAITVPARGEADLSYELQPLPGRVEVRSDPEGAEVSIDGESVGSTPLPELLLESGEYEMVFEAEGYQTLRRQLQVEGLDKQQLVEVTLLPKAQVSFSSSPDDAEISIDGKALARTPATVGLDAGSHEVVISKSGYKPWSDTIEVSGSEALTVPEVELEQAPAGVRITSVPDGARVTIDGRARGRTPMTLTVEPDTPTEIVLSHPGYQDLRNVVTIPANTERSLKGILTPNLGEVAVRADPPDAHVFVKGEDLGPASRVLRLPAVETELVFRKPGYIEQRRTVTPDPARRQEVSVTLETELQARMEQLPDWIETGDGQRLRLMMPGRFVMGAPRGQQGRRANEVQRQVELTRPYYIADREVTNARFRAFRNNHSSGIIGDKTLDNDRQPVVRISWNDAAAFCNWLSLKDGLDPAYRDLGGYMELIQPVPNGYRLPTEAEWAWAARFAGNRNLKYAWGEGMPPPDAAGNYADLSARELMQTAMPNYDDGWAATAPVGAFKPNEFGLYDIGGNVSEWINDFYESGLNASTGLERDPLGPAGGNDHVVRGSSWRHASITELRLSWRDQAVEGRDDLGFRIARYAE